jgi:hypothetical protein
MVDEFESFFKVTGVYQDTVNQDFAKAKSFGMKFQETFQPEALSSIDEMRMRSERLNSQAPVVLGIPKSFTYYFIVVGLTYLAYNLLTK